MPRHICQNSALKKLKINNNKNQSNVIKKGVEKITIIFSKNTMTSISSIEAKILEKGLYWLEKDEDDNTIAKTLEDIKMLYDNTDKDHQGTTTLKTNIITRLKTFNSNNFDSQNYPHQINIKTAFAVINVVFSNKTDSVPVATTTKSARTNFYANESWWGRQLMQAKSMIYQRTPYSWAKSTKVLEITSPHFYYFVNGPQNC